MIFYNLGKRYHSPLSNSSSARASLELLIWPFCLPSDLPVWLLFHCLHYCQPERSFLGGGDVGADISLAGNPTQAAVLRALIILKYKVGQDISHLRNLQWLPLPSGIDFKLLVLASKASVLNFQVFWYVRLSHTSLTLLMLFPLLRMPFWLCADKPSHLLGLSLGIRSSWKFPWHPALYHWLPSPTIL